MGQAAAHPPGETLNDFIELYEQAQARDGQADLAQFLPRTDHPLYLEVLRELVRVDLEYGWNRGRPRTLEDYQRTFPSLFEDRRSLCAVTFEDYRLRQQAGERPSLADYRERFGVDGALDWAEWTDEAPSSNGAPDDPLAPLLGPRTRGHPLQTRIRPPWPEKTQVWESIPDGDEELAQAAQAYRAFRRRHGGSEQELESYLRPLANDSVAAQLFRDLHRSDPRAADRLARAMTSLPEPGTTFLDFQLLEELGRGAFGKVYLARQGDLANRLVALKVATDFFGESQTLAQLQHTNIVPIYSLHRASPFHAVCMPYFGATTLAAVLDGQQAAAGGESTPVPGHGPLTTDRSLWLAARLADGLAHAHERGILHRDLKPANILLTDHGEPMLLDFNLSEDTKVRGPAAAALIGGTLPYMAPEHLEAFHCGPRSVDARSDVYAFGLILYEMLTRRQAFERLRGSSALVLDRMIAARRGPPPDLRRWNPTITPALEAIVRRCLEPDPARRYPHARALHEDLQRQLEHRPLRHIREPSLRERVRKWRRRHPRLTSSLTVLAAAGLAITALILLLLLRGRQLDRLRAAETLGEFRDAQKAAQFRLLAQRRGDTAHLDEGVRLCRQALGRYQVLDDPAWQQAPAVRYLSEEDRQQLREEIGELLLLWARVTLLTPAASTEEQPEAVVQQALRLNQLAEACYPAEDVPRVLWKQRAELARSLGQEAEAQRLLQRAEQTPPRGARNLGLVASEHAAQHRFADGLPLLKEATRQEPQNFWLWFELGMCHDGLEQHAAAAACYSTCIALSPRFSPAYYKRGSAYLHDKQYPLACADFDEALRRQPDLVDAFIDRGLARFRLQQYAGAIADWTQALELGTPYTRVYFMRARARERTGDVEGSRRDRAQGLSRRPLDEESWVARGEARLTDDPRGALADYEQALRANPRSLAGLRGKAHVLAERLKRPQEALEVSNRLLTLYPDHAPARSGRGVLLARLGKYPEALQDAEACLALDSSPERRYQVAGIYALASQNNADHRREALLHLAAALRKGYGFDLLDADPDLAPIRARPEFRAVVETARQSQSKIPPRPAP